MKSARAKRADHPQGDHAVQSRPRLRAKPPKVKPHVGNKAWRVRIGKSVVKGQLKVKSWYFPNMTEAEANRKAAKIFDAWAFIFRNWARLYQPTLEVIGSPFATIPHWQPNVPSTQPSDAAIAKYQDRPPTAEELQEAYADATLDTVFGLYQIQQKAEVAVGERQNITRASVEKNIRCGLRFFPSRLKMANLTAEVLIQAKAGMLAAVSRRTAKNYLADLRAMLIWFYEHSTYGQGFDKPTGFDRAFSVPKAMRTDITVYSPQNIGKMLATATDRTRLYIMLMLNCGMYASDIGRLTRAEVNLEQGYIYWDREKEPQNPFKVKHDLWPETLELVKRHLQARGVRCKPCVDYRRGKAETIDPSTLAFVDSKGQPIYRVKANGTAYSGITEAFKHLNRDREKAWQPHNLRKSTNQLLVETLEARLDDDDTEGLVAVGEISKMFLAEKTNILVRLYRQNGLKIFGRMNKYLAQVGDLLRSKGAFKSLKK